MRYKLTILFLCFIFTGIVSAQDDDQTPYEVALARIAEAEASGATELDLSNIGLTELPPEIGNLNNLQVLLLWANYLTNLPPEIGQLSNLQGLALGINQLTSLPPEIGQLSNLRQIILWQNQLTSIPPEIGNLTNLCVLILSENELRSLPHELGQLTRLVSGTDCPSDFGLIVNENPLISPPDEVLAQGTDEILAYLRNEAWWHLQRMIVSIGAGIGLIIMAVLGLLWRNQRGKRKRKNDEIVMKS